MLLAVAKMLLIFNVDVSHYAMLSYEQHLCES